MSPEKRKAVRERVAVARQFIPPPRRIGATTHILERSGADIALEELANAIDLIFDADETNENLP
jgi:hypothetical protein